MNLTQANILIMGLGMTGLSCARYCQNKGYRYSLYDQIITNEKSAELKSQFNSESFSGDITDDLIAGFDVLIVSPGIPLNQTVFKQAKAQGKIITSDIELFVNETKAKLIGITGSNGKTTVTTWVTKVFAQLGIKVAMGGNVGKPVLDLLNDDIDVVVLELSSFQLDLYKNIPLDIAVILNISPDHLDRYDSFAAYQQSKVSICDSANVCLVDQQTHTLINKNHLVFGKHQADYVYRQNKTSWSLTSDDFNLEFDNNTLFSEVERINALVVLSIATLFKIKASSVDPLLSTLTGLAHRNQFVASINDVKYINDSKGTNVGATVTAIQAQQTPVILIAGGLAKGANFDELKTVIKQHCKALVLIGQDGQLIAESVNGENCYFTDGLGEAVNKATKLATKGDTVLLSPACASFDMFSGYQDRGNQFIQHVTNLQAGVAC